MNRLGSEMTDEDWFNLGKSDAWAKKPKVPPEQDALAASMYDLGYSEGEIKHPPTETTQVSCYALNFHVETAEGQGSKGAGERV